MRTNQPLIIGNWKMNTTLADALVLANGIRGRLEHIEKTKAVLCPPMIWLTEVAHCIPKKSLPHIALGAQDGSGDLPGTHTGQVSMSMIHEVAQYVLIGHSERVLQLGETLPLLSRKIHMACEAGLTPVLCIGEHERSDASVEQVLTDLRKCIEPLTKEELAKLVVAYEPVWAIGNGNVSSASYATETCPAPYAQRICARIRAEVGVHNHVLFGGSSSPATAESYLSQPDIDGLLSGGASLKIDTFVQMVEIAERIAHS